MAKTSSHSRPTTPRKTTSRNVATILSSTMHPTATPSSSGETITDAALGPSRACGALPPSPSAKRSQNRVDCSTSSISVRAINPNRTRMRDTTIASCADSSKSPREIVNFAGRDRSTRSVHARCSHPSQLPRRTTGRSCSPRDRDERRSIRLRWRTRSLVRHRSKDR